MVRITDNVITICGHYFYFSVHYIKRPGAVLSAGATIARLVLDNPDHVKAVRLFC